MALTLEEVAHQLGISKQAARRLILYEKTIPHFKVGARGIRVKEEELEAYIAKLEEVKKEEKTPGRSEDVVPKEVYKGRGILDKEGKDSGS